MRPFTSGAMRISVSCATPMIGAGGRFASHGRKTNAAANPTPTATARIASAMRMELRRMSDPSSLEQPGGGHREQAVDRGQDPKVHPIAPDVMQGGAHLVDAHQPVDRRRARKDAAC